MGIETEKDKIMSKIWQGSFEFAPFDDSPQPTVVALTPAETVKFKVTTDMTWNQVTEYPTTIFGIHFEDNFVALLFHTVEGADGSVQGAWYIGHLADEEDPVFMEYTKFAGFSDWTSEHTFELGWYEDEMALKVIYYGEPIASFGKKVLENAPGEPVRFIAPRRASGVGNRNRWEVPIKLLK